MPSTKAPSRIDTVKFLTAMGRALGANVEVRTKPGRPPRPAPLEDLLSGVVATPVPATRSVRKLHPNPSSFRRRLARAKTEEEALAIIEEMRQAPRHRKYSPKWDEATIRRYLPPTLKHLNLEQAA